MYALPLPRLHSTLFRAAWLVLLLFATGGCDGEEEWSPLEGPWDPNHPEAQAILAPPAADDPIDREMADAGERWYRVRGCLACHRVDGTDVVGPALNGVTERREYEWYRAMVMKPDSMLQVDPIAQDLARMYRVPMPDQGIGELRTRAIWEYLRRVDREGR
jgi:cytochrome c551/c552